MGKDLIIVESPAKVKTIKKFLGSKYMVQASVGHIRDLPTRSIGVDESRDFAPQYEIIKGKEKVVKDLQEAAAKADTGEDFGMESSQAKLFASETANEVARACVDILGEAGCTDETMVECMFRDAKITEIYEGTNEIQRLIIAGNMDLKG